MKGMELLVFITYKNSGKTYKEGCVKSFSNNRSVVLLQSFVTTFTFKKSLKVSYDPVNLACIITSYLS